ncbi:MAG: RAMP superfamily CRISPR-associated protein [Candidatus Bathyarchaeia archaeon]
MSRVKFKVRVKPVGLLSIGSIYSSFASSDVAFARKPSMEGGKSVYKHYIPGSSFKGALRSSTCRIAEVFGFKSCSEVDVGMIEKAHSRNGICDVCRLFGYPKSNTPSVLSVSDFELQGYAKPYVITGIRIEDESGKVAEGALFSTEKLYGSEFLGEISLTTDDVNLIGLTLLSLSELRLDCFGRRSQIDLKIEDTEGLERLLKGSKWISLLDELKEWLYDEILQD